MTAQIQASPESLCEHYWAWVSPKGTNRSARLCMLCHQPDPRWLDHIIEVDKSDTCDANPCVHCEFGEALDPRPGGDA